MNVIAMGKIASVTPGTPVKLATATTYTCHITAQTAPANTGKVYLGTPAMVKATLAGVIHVFEPPVTGQPLEIWDLEPHAEEDPLHLEQYAIDADVAAEGLILTYWEQ